MPGSRCNETVSGSGGDEYRGCQATTVSGRTCQAWSSQAPHQHTRTAENYPRSGLDLNYCRNPDGSGTIWCYTTDPNVRWEHCITLRKGKLPPLLPDIFFHFQSPMSLHMNYILVGDWFVANPNNCTRNRSTSLLANKVGCRIRFRESVFIVRI